LKKRSCFDQIIDFQAQATGGVSLSKEKVQHENC
jgi:hypothetical protein